MYGSSRMQEIAMNLFAPDAICVETEQQSRV
jgi:hypothetical protein